MSLIEHYIGRLSPHLTTPGGPPPGPANPNVPPTLPPPQGPPNPPVSDNYSLSRNGDRLTVRDAFRRETIQTTDEQVISRAVNDFLRRNGLFPVAPRLPQWLRVRLRQASPTGVNVLPAQPVITNARPLQIARNKYVITGILGALLLGGYLGYEVRDHNLLNMSANTRFTSQTIAPGECVDAPGGSIAVRKAAINGVVLYSSDPGIEMVTRLNDGAQVCATGGEPVTLQYLGGNSQLMDTVEQNDINLMQANGCNGRRCNKVTPITYPYP